METSMLGSKAVNTPMDPNLKLCDERDGEPIDKGRYQRLVRKLIYLAHTKPDIAFAGSVVSQFMHAPKQSHLDALLRIMKYLMRGIGCGIGHSAAAWNQAIPNIC